MSEAKLNLSPVANRIADAVEAVAIGATVTNAGDGQTHNVKIIGAGIVPTILAVLNDAPELWPGPVPPRWYTERELLDVLTHNTALTPTEAKAVAAEYADNLQRAFAKGYSMAARGLPGETVPPPTMEVIFHTLETTIDDQRETRFLAQVNGRMVGHIGMCVQPFNSMFLRELYVDEVWQGKGIARGLLQAACQAAHMRNAKVVCLHVGDKNSRAITLYLRMGFDVVDYNFDTQRLVMARPLVAREHPTPALYPQ